MAAASTTAATAATPVLQVAEIDGKGRSLIAAQPLRAGQIVLRDSPIILYSPFPLIPTAADGNKKYCSHCYRILQIAPSSSSSAVSCPSCPNAVFCSPSCLAAAAPTSHTPWVCETLTRLRQSSLVLSVDEERQVQLRFLVAAYNLAVVSPSDFRVLLTLKGAAADSASSSSSSSSSASLLHSLISAVSPPPIPEFSEDLTAALLAKDDINTFGLMGPFSSDGERHERAYGIYPNASLFNHDCLPNACRFDYVDTAADGNTDFIIRMIHDVAQGREICLSYFPVKFNYSERQRRLRELFGFTCDCERCKIEANWSDHEEDADEDVMDEDDEEPMAADENGDDDDFPHAYFFYRFTCDGKNCCGTLAPLPPQDSTPSNILECNVCGKLKNDDDDDEGVDGDGEADDKLSSMDD